VIVRRLDTCRGRGYEGLSGEDRSSAKEASVTSDTLPQAKAAHGDADPVVLAALAILVIATATIAGAWFFQLVLDIKPCPLCLEQRYAYYAIIPLSALIAFVAWRGGPRAVLLLGLALLLIAGLGNAVFGAYHAGVEWGFWKGPTDCTGPLVDFGKAGNLLEQLDKVKVIRCDEVQWRFLGLSLAGYNALISLMMAAVAGLGIARSARA
jgi:disulfide bond formation protein DsbB